VLRCRGRLGVDLLGGIGGGMRGLLRNGRTEIRVLWWGYISWRMQRLVLRVGVVPLEGQEAVGAGGGDVEGDAGAARCLVW